MHGSSPQLEIKGAAWSILGLRPGVNRSLWALCYELGLASIYIGSFIIYAVTRGEMPKTIPFLILLALYFLLHYAFLSKRPGFHEDAPSAILASAEAVFMVVAIGLLDAWESALWLLLAFPILRVACVGSIGLFLTFSGTIAGTPAIYLAIRSQLHNRLELSFFDMPTQWFFRIGYISLLTLPVCLLLSNLYATSPYFSRIVRLFRDSTHKREIPWNQIIEHCEAILRAERIRLLEFKALTGRIKLLTSSTMSQTQAVQNDSTLEFSVSGSDPFIKRLKKEKYALINASSIPKPWSLWALPEGKSNYVLVSAIFNPATQHLMGFLIAEYSIRIFEAWDIGLKPHASTIASITQFLALILDYSRTTNVEERLDEIAIQSLEMRNSIRSSELAVRSLGEVYGIGCTIWCSLPQHSPRVFYSIATNTDIALNGYRNKITISDDNLLADLASKHIVMLSKNDQIDDELYHEARDRDDSKTHINWPLADSSTSYLPILWSEKIHVLLSLHVISDHEHAVDLENTVSAVSHSRLIPNLRLSFIHSQLTEQENMLRRFHMATNNLREFFDFDTSIPLELLAEAAASVLKLDHVYWCEFEKKTTRLYLSDGATPFTGNIEFNTMNTINRLILDADRLRTSIVKWEPLHGSAQMEGKIAFQVFAVLQIKHRWDVTRYLLLYGRRRPWSTNIGPAEVEVVASYVSAVLSSSNYSERMRRYSEALEKLGDVANEVLSEDRLDDVLRHAADAAKRLTSADLATIQLISRSDNNRLFVKTFSGPEGLDESLHNYSEIKIGTGVTGKAAETGKTINLGDVSTHKQYITIFNDSKSELAVPLRSINDNRTLGVINVESLEKDHFSSIHVEILERLTTQIVIALQKAEYLEELEEIKERLEHTESLALIGLLYGEDIHLTSNKLGAARQFAKNLKNSADSSPETREIASEIELNIQAVINVVRNIRNTVAAPKLANVDLHELLDSTWMDLKKSKKINYVRNYRARDKVFYGLQKQVGQVFRVVMKNGIGALHGEGEIKVTTKDFQQQSQRYLSIDLCDTGIGIPSGEIPYLFSLNKKPRRGNRTGIGLAWCRLFLAIYGGSISVESSRNKGTTVQILVPKDVTMTAGRLLLAGRR